MFGKKGKRDEFLRGTPGGSPEWAEAGLDPELQELMDLEEAERQAATSSSGFSPPLPSSPSSSGRPASGSASRMDRLQQLGDLRAQGLLTDAEFEQEKARILSEP